MYCISALHNAILFIISRFVHYILLYIFYFFRLLELEDQYLAAAAASQNQTTSRRAVNEIYSFDQVSA